MRRLLILSSLAIAAMTAPVAAHASILLGISDQQASTFTNQLYGPLNLTAARYVAPWDVTSDSKQLTAFAAWYAAAQVAHQKLLVSFEHSRTSGKAGLTPSTAQFTSAMKAFHKAFPAVKIINTWNEVNACQKGGATERQPLGICKSSKAKVLVSFYKVDKTIFKGAKIIPLDVLDDRSSTASTAVAYIKAFKTQLSKAHVTAPALWGVHNYSDTNRFQNVRLTKIQKAIGPKGDIWLLETGGQLTVFGGTEAQKEAGAAKALGCMFYTASKFKRIKAMFIYQFNGAAPGASFDAGLINQNGSARPGYAVVKARTKTKCP